MTFRILSILTLAGALLAQGPGPGEPRGFGPHRMAMTARTDKVQTYLNLTDSQIQSLQQLRQSEMAALKPIMEQIRPLRQSLHSQMQSGSSDAAAVSKLMQSIQALEQQAAPIRSSFQQQALALLTADQKTKLAALESAASLMPAVHEATALNLLTPPKGPDGPFGPGGPAPEDRP